MKKWWIVWKICFMTRLLSSGLRPGGSDPRVGDGLI